MHLAVVFLTVIVLKAALFAQELPQTKVTLNTGEVITTSAEVFEDSLHVWFEKDGKVVMLTRAEVKDIYRPLPCPLTIENSPELRGFKLGQSLEQVRRRFPRNSSLSLPGPAAQANLGLNDLAGHSELEGVKSVSLGFLDNKLALLAVTYDVSVHWDSSDQFKTSLANSLKLQQSGWKSRGTARVLDCEGFTIEAAGASGAMVMLTKRGLEADLDARRKAFEQQKRDAFKP